MRRLKEHARRHVVCIRVSDVELAVLEELARGGKNISTLMREALLCYLPEWQGRRAQRSVNRG